MSPLATSAARPGGLLLGALIGVAAPELSSAGPDAAVTSVGALLLVNIYALAAYALKQTTGQQMQRIADPPNVALFQGPGPRSCVRFRGLLAIPTVVFHASLLIMDLVALALLRSHWSAVGGA